MSRGAAIALVASTFAGCATVMPRRSKAVPDIGVHDCAAGAAGALLSVDALQCWLKGPHGRWRILSHDSHFDVLVVQAEALDLRDAAFIANAWASSQHAFSEILIYVHEPAHGGQRRTRRVRWTNTAPLEIFDFTAPA